MWVDLVRPAADFMVQFRDPDSKLPLPSYDLWEERWGVHAFTVATVYGGLKAARNFAPGGQAVSAGERPVVAAAGGDGTINLVAALVVPADVPFGLIPLGTFNFLARHLGIPLTPRAAALALATGVIRRIPVGRVNGHLFLNNASLGLYQQLLEEREGYKRRFGRYQLVAVLAAVATLLRFRKLYTLRLDLDGRPVAFHTPMLFFGLNSLQFEKLGMDAVRCTREGMMAVITLQPAGFWKLLGLALRGALQRLHDSSDLRTHCAMEAQVLLPGRRRIRVAVDGESLECALPLQFEVVRDALQMVVPREPEERR